LKVAVIGGGSTYTPELVDGLLRRRDTLPTDELWLMDTALDRLEVVGGFARWMVEAAGAPFTVHLTTNRPAAIEGATFVITQIRIGGMQAHREDEHLGIQHGLVGQETTGVGGMAKALRTIPVMLDIAGDVARLAPDAFLVNFANPSGLITEALLRHSQVRAIGLCNIPWSARNQIAQWLAVPAEEVEMDYVGLNHLSWIRGVRVRGQDMTEQMLSAYIGSPEQGDGHSIAPHLVQVFRAWLSYYLRYYYHTDQVIEEQRAAARTRAEEVMEVEQELIALYSDPSLAAMGQQNTAYTRYNFADSTSLTFSH
jgi:6-phospho-beta-glucosidase